MNWRFGAFTQLRYNHGDIRFLHKSNSDLFTNDSVTETFSVRVDIYSQEILCCYKAYRLSILTTKSTIWLYHLDLLVRLKIVVTFLTRLSFSESLLDAFETPRTAY
jgi:hypothetical protein